MNGFMRESFVFSRGNFQLHLAQRQRWNGNLSVSSEGDEPLQQLSLTAENDNSITDIVHSRKNLLMYSGLIFHKILLKWKK